MLIVHHPKSEMFVTSQFNMLCSTMLPIATGCLPQLACIPSMD